MNDPSRLPIALFDSGMGGLTVLKAVGERLPNEDLLYLGDTARLPYGTKGQDTIIRYTLKAAAKLLDYGAKMLVVACNTATAAALPTLRETFAPLPVLGVVEPGAQAAVNASHNGEIVVIATEATVASGVYQQAISRLRPDAHVQGRACTLFVPMAEEGLMDGPLVEGIAWRYLESLFAPALTLPRPDTLLLGCTHFPLFEGALRQVLGEQVNIVNPAATVAQGVEQLLTRRQLLRDAGHTGQRHFLTTDNRNRFVRIGKLFLGSPLAQDDVELVDL